MSAIEITLRPASESVSEAVIINGKAYEYGFVLECCENFHKVLDCLQWIISAESERSDALRMAEAVLSEIE